MTATAEVWPVCTGKSFDLWQPDIGYYYDSVDAAAISDHLQQKRAEQATTATSGFSEQPSDVIDDPLTLPCKHPRIAFRDVTNPTNTRTLVAALIPPDRVLVHQAPYLLRTAGDAADEAYVLGVLCSMPCDWQARRTVELHMTFEQINQLSIPDPGPGDPVRDRVTDISAALAVAADNRLAGWASAASLNPAGGGRAPCSRSWTRA